MDRESKKNVVVAFMVTAPVGTLMMWAQAQVCESCGRLTVLMTLIEPGGEEATIQRAVDEPHEVIRSLKLVLVDQEEATVQGNWWDHANVAFLRHVIERLEGVHGSSAFDADEPSAANEPIFH